MAKVCDPGFFKINVFVPVFFDSGHNITQWG
jgi:hypothetical protein